MAVSTDVSKCFISSKHITCYTDKKDTEKNQRSYTGSYTKHFTKSERVVQYTDIIRFMALHNRHHKVSPNLNPKQNSHSFARLKERDTL